MFGGTDAIATISRATNVVRYPTVGIANPYLSIPLDPLVTTTRRLTSLNAINKYYPDDTIDLPIHEIMTMMQPIILHVILLILLVFVPCASAFTVPRPNAVTVSTTALGDSRRKQKIATRTVWLEGREGSTTEEAADTKAVVTAGLHTNDQGLEYIQLVHPDSGAAAEIYPYGGVVTSYQDGAGTEFIAVRPDAVLDGSKPISGGLSHCWPQFGPGAIQQHGFARNVIWSVDRQTETEVTLTLEPNDYTKAIWDAAFKCTFTVALQADQLDTKMLVENTGEEPWSFQAALHSYFTVSALENLAIKGSWKGKEFLNKLVGDSGEMQTEERDVITIAEEYDRVYRGVNDPVLEDSGTKKAIAVLNTAGWEDTVVWNPYGNEKMGYNTFVCVESVKFDPVSLQGGASWVGDMTLKPSSI
jgi:glucose-6-phosphate 1-epimerase